MYQRPFNRMERAFQQHDGNLPVEWQWMRATKGAYLREENCGICGGSDVGFLRHYARTAVELVTTARNAAAWSTFDDKYPFSWCIEQLMLAACIDFHRSHPDSLFPGVYVRYVFPGSAEAHDMNRAARAGVTHLLGNAKSHPAIAKRIEGRVEREYPEYFRRCQQVASVMS